MDGSFENYYGLLFWIYNKYGSGWMRQVLPVLSQGKYKYSINYIKLLLSRLMKNLLVDPSRSGALLIFNFLIIFRISWFEILSISKIGGNYKVYFLKDQVGLVRWQAPIVFQTNISQRRLLFERTGLYFLWNFSY